MKRQAITLAAIADRANLERALWKAARGKSRSAVVARWRAAPDRYLNALAASILDGTAPSGSVRRFAIHDPKPRLISVHGFADRVLHHAILNLAEARFERMLVPTGFACRPGLGVHAAVRQVQRNLRRFGWWVQVDVAAYFASIDHARLLALMARRFKGADFLALLRRIVERGAPPAAGRGLPIGALTSQHLANAYLDSADRFLFALAPVRAHVRYMDDIVWWCDTRDDAQRTLAALRTHLWAERGLRLKAGARIGRSAQGITFCGFRVRAGALLPSRRARCRWRQGARALARAQAQGLAEADLQRAHAVLAARLAHTASLHFRRRVWAALAARAGRYSAAL